MPQVTWDALFSQDYGLSESFSDIDIDYDPEGGTNFQDWIQGQSFFGSPTGGASQGAYSNIAQSYTTYDPESSFPGINLHQLELTNLAPGQTFSEAFGEGSGYGNPSLMQVLGMTGLFTGDVEYDMTYGQADDLGNPYDQPGVLEMGGYSQWEQEALMDFMRKGEGAFANLAGGPDFGDDIANAYQREKDLWNVMIGEGGWFEAYGMEGKLGEDIENLDLTLEDTIAAAELSRDKSLDVLGKQKKSATESTLQQLMSTKRKGAKGVRGGSRMNRMLDVGVQSLAGIRSQERQARDLAASTIEGAETLHGLQSANLQTAFNLEGMAQMTQLSHDIETAQTEFEDLVTGGYEAWYDDILAQVEGFYGTEYGWTEDEEIAWNPGTTNQ